MEKEIIFCRYKENKETLTIEKKEGKSIFTIDIDGNVSTKELPVEYINNLDIFFRIYDTDKWESIPYRKSTDIEKTISIRTNDKEYNLSSLQDINKEEKSIFNDLKRYIESYYKESFKPIVLSFHSFDGGGPIYNLKMIKSDIFTWYSKRKYYNANHENLCGAGYDVIYTFFPLRKGKGSAKVTGDSPICKVAKSKITIDIDENLNMKESVIEVKDE